MTLHPSLQSRVFRHSKDPEDKRDYQIVFEESRKASPTKVSKFPIMKIPCYDQGNLGSCTANAIGAALQNGFLLESPRLSNSMPSRLFIYFCEREMINTINSDSGAYIRDGIKAVSKLGACLETTWPYDIPKFTQRPPSIAYAEAKLYKATQYARVKQSKSQIRACIDAGQPIVIGILVYDTFVPNSKGWIPDPDPKKDELLGGHAVLLTGYTNKGVLCRNSWGKQWGLDGYFYLSWKYVLDWWLADDFWTIIKTTVPPSAKIIKPS